MVVKWSNKSVLVTGGAGFIAGSLIEDLVKQGAIVDVIDDFSVGSKDTIPDGVNYVFDGVVCEKNLPKCRYDMVFHFAAPCTVIQYRDNPLDVFAKAFESAYSIREFCKENKIPYLVYASSATYYGSSTDNWRKMNSRFGIQEDICRPTPDNIYAVSKVTEECLDGLYPELNTLALRMFPAFGAREKMKGKYASVPYQIIKEMSEGRPFEIWGDGEQERDFIYIDDLVYCIRSLVERGATGAYNLGTGKTISTNNLVNTVNKLLEVEIPAKYVPVPNYKYTKILKSDPSKLLDKIGDYTFMSIEDAVKDMLEDM